MALFKKPSPEEKFAASPPGRALAAYERGDLFFQASISASQVEGWAEPDPKKKNDTVVVRTFNSPDVLGQIEEIGWRLEHVSWVHEQIHMKTSEVGNRSSARVVGSVTGIYLFRRRGQL